MIGKTVASLVFFLIMMISLAVTARAEDGIAVPDELYGFLDSIGDEAEQFLGDGLYGSDVDGLGEAANGLTTPSNLISMLLTIVFEGAIGVLPAFASVLCIVVVSALCGKISSYCSPSLARATDLCIRCGTFCAVAAVSISRLEGLRTYFERLFEAVAAFIPLSAALYAMGGNLSMAASSTASLSAVLTVCQFICTHTVIPVFCFCFCLSAIGVFDAGGAVGSSIGASVRKWYVTAMSFVMIILTGAISSQSIISSRTDGVAMRGAKLAVSSFVPVFGGSLSSTLGTLSTSVELLRASVGIIGVVAIFVMLLPTVVELALMRAAFGVGAFCAGLVGCDSEQKLLGDVGSLYGYLEGAALMCSAIFVIAFGILAVSSTPFS